MAQTGGALDPAKERGRREEVRDGRPLRAAASREDTLGTAQALSGQ
jgi:hypothetical protein